MQWMEAKAEKKKARAKGTAAPKAAKGKGKGKKATRGKGCSRGKGLKRKRADEDQNSADDVKQEEEDDKNEVPCPEDMEVEEAGGQSEQEGQCQKCLTSHNGEESADSQNRHEAEQSQEVESSEDGCDVQHVHSEGNDAPAVVAADDDIVVSSTASQEVGAPLCDFIEEEENSVEADSRVALHAPDENNAGSASAAVDDMGSIQPEPAAAPLPEEPSQHGEEPRGSMDRAPEAAEAPAEAPRASDEAPRAAGGPRASGPKVHSTPDILARLEPCHIFRLRLNFNDHRFTLDTRGVSDERWIGSMGQKSWSKGFKVSRDWEGALKQVHRHMWEKWSVTQDRWPLRPGMAEQEPGEVPEDVINDLKPIILGMPAPKY